MSNHKFDPDRRARLRSPERLLRLPPRKILRRAGLRKGEVFVDIGCGTGFFTLSAAVLVGQRGTAYGLDISPTMLADLTAAARRKGISNLQPVLSSESGRELPPGASLYFMANVFHELDNKEAYLASLHGRMGRASRLAIVDYHKKRTRHGPPVGQRVSRRKALQLLAAAGFHLVESFEVNSEEYGLLAQKAAQKETS